MARYIQTLTTPREKNRTPELLAQEFEYQKQLAREREKARVSGGNMFRRTFSRR